ncbi:hypothetical protein BOTBODRAFT_569411 [Botryobasidium botryosum FD-172 SS1]|uniref:Uncharacterized protein n=1 Tax=Botryobasidium botryosum (strain FD-172 SS1) TaxID=930990 RepID=A0A067LYP1_BOTB1|nr:hypothetical protein BOTBODRAFT_569411 [Botryobasidium botryosum FD-172 SS1]
MTTEFAVLRSFLNYPLLKAASTSPDSHCHATAALSSRLKLSQERIKGLKSEGRADVAPDLSHIFSFAGTKVGFTIDTSGFSSRLGTRAKIRTSTYLFEVTQPEHLQVDIQTTPLPGITQLEASRTLCVPPTMQRQKPMAQKIWQSKDTSYIVAASRLTSTLKHLQL